MKGLGLSCCGGREGSELGIRRVMGSTSKEEVHVGMLGLAMPSS